MTARTDLGLSAALDCSGEGIEDLQDGILGELQGEPRDAGTARSYLRDAAWAGSQWR